MLVGQITDDLQDAGAIAAVGMAGPDSMDLHPVVGAAPELDEAVGVLRIAEAVAEIFNAVGDPGEGVEERVDVAARAADGWGSGAFGEASKREDVHIVREKNENEYDELLAEPDGVWKRLWTRRLRECC